MKVKIQGRKRRVTIVVDHGHWKNKNRMFIGKGVTWIAPKPIPPIPSDLRPWDGRPGRYIPGSRDRFGKMSKMGRLARAEALG